MLVFSCNNSYVIASNNFSPTWLKKGAYAEYLFPSIGSSIQVTPEGDVITTELPEAVFRWECVELNETFANLEITFYYNETETEQHLFNVFVHIFNRAVYLQNGTLIGTTSLWLPANPSPEEDIIVWDVPPDRIIFNIANPTLETRVVTPQGRQRPFKIDGMSELANGKMFSIHITCDFDTGVLINGQLDSEPTIKLLGISGFMVSTITLLDTNIDLGPNDNPIDLRTISTVAALTAAFIIIFVTVYRRRTKRR